MTAKGHTDIYIDTDTVVNATIRGLRHTASCRDSFGMLLGSGSVIYFSIILRMEYIQAIRNLANRGQLPVSLRDEFELDNWADWTVRHRWMQNGLAQMDVLLSELPTVIELPLTSTIVTRASMYMARYALRSQDAVHVATATHYDIPVFWTCDDHFSRVGDLYVEIIRDQD